MLVLGFTVVLTLGRPLPTSAEELAAAYHPPVPVSQEAALASAATIVRLEHPGFAGITPTIQRRIDSGIDRWLIAFGGSDTEGARGLRVSITVESGRVEVATYP